MQKHTSEGGGGREAFPTFPKCEYDQDLVLWLQDDTRCRPSMRDVMVALCLALLVALTVFAFFSWLPLVAHACVFGLVFAAVILFGRKIASAH